jgi:hypothetical protein
MKHQKEGKHIPNFGILCAVLEILGHRHRVLLFDMTSASHTDIIHTLLDSVVDPNPQ